MESGGSLAKSSKLVRPGFEAVVKNDSFKAINSGIGDLSLDGTAGQWRPQVTPQTSIYDGIWKNITMKGDIVALRTSVEEKRNVLRPLAFPVGATIKVNEFNIKLKKFAIRLADVIIHHLEALENIVATGNMPADDVFEQFERSSRRLRKFLASEAGKFVGESRDLIGGPVAQEFNAVFESVDHQVEYLALALHRIGEAVMSAENKLDYVVRQATIVSNRVVKLKAIIDNQMFESMKVTVERIFTANNITESFVSFEAKTNHTLNKTITNFGIVLVDLNNTTQNVYITGQQAITANLNSAISQLSLFENSTVLSRLSQEIEENYRQLHNMLSKQQLSKLFHINRYYKMIFENSADLTQNMTSIVLDASNRSASQYLDLFMNGYYGPKLDCGEKQLVFDFAQDVANCLESEQTECYKTVEAFGASVSLLQTASNAVAASIARCNNTMFATNPVLFAQSRACLKTNIRDTARLVKLLEPQLEQVDTIIKQNVEVSRFRLENCLATTTHEITAMLKTSRALMRSCARRIEGFPIEEKYEDDEGEWYWSYREAVVPKKDDLEKSVLKVVFNMSEDYQLGSTEHGTSIDSEETSRRK